MCQKFIIGRASLGRMFFFFFFFFFSFDPETYTTGKTLSVSGFTKSVMESFGHRFYREWCWNWHFKNFGCSDKKFLPEELGPTWGWNNRMDIWQYRFSIQQIVISRCYKWWGIKNSKTMYHRLKTDPSEDIDFSVGLAIRELGIREEEIQPLHLIKTTRTI